MTKKQKQLATQIFAIIAIIGMLVSTFAGGLLALL